MNSEMKYIGHGRKLIDGREKVTGHVQYTADFQTARLLHAKVILSPHAHALITSVDKTAALELPGVVAVLTADELPTAKNTITSRNSAVLAVGRVQWVGQPVAVVVAETVLSGRSFQLRTIRLLRKLCRWLQFLTISRRS
jgi:CO/xanthine dehydrogenase Mo-binding subunit